MKLQLIKGFLWIRYDVFDNPNLNASDMLVYASLMRYIHNETKTCFPSLALLEKKSRLVRNTVIKSLKVLEEQGLIAVTRKLGKANNYLMLEPTSANFAPVASAKEDPALVQINPTNNTNLNNTNKNLCATAEQKEIIAHLNERLGLVKPHGFKDTNQQTLKLLNARLKDYTKADVIAVIDLMCDKRIGTEWQQFLRPQTLFNVNKFEGYVNSIAVKDTGINPLEELK